VKTKLLAIAFLVATLSVFGARPAAAGSEPSASVTIHDNGCQGSTVTADFSNFSTGDYITGFVVADQNLPSGFGGNFSLFYLSGSGTAWIASIDGPVQTLDVIWEVDAWGPYDPATFEEDLPVQYGVGDNPTTTHADFAATGCDPDPYPSLTMTAGKLPPITAAKEPTVSTTSYLWAFPAFLAAAGCMLFLRRRNA
jgi:hypothetical protein